MNEQRNNGGRPNMQDWEAQINDLLDGELGADDAERLKNAADQDQELARAIIEAYQLQQAMAAIPVEQAPASLRRKLRRVPREQRRTERSAWLQPRWAGAMAMALLVAVVAINQLGPKQPSEAEIAQAEQDLKIALAYLGKVGRRTGLEIESNVSDGMNDVVTGNLIRTIEYQMKFNKEHEA
jgi:ferric-dicitrate binding protein FerR (iron transport regulator)